MTRPRTLLPIVGAFLLAVVGWFVAGWIASAAGLDELALPARVGGVFLLLSLGDQALARLAGRHGGIS
jgi:hypothetical protein